MTIYDDLFVRSELADRGTIPKPGSDQSLSPDINPFGLEPVNHPTEIFAGTYAENIGKSLIVHGQNYIYLRSINLFPGARAGVCSLYWVP